MKKASDPILDIGPGDGQETTCEVRHVDVRVRVGDEYQRVPVKVELTLHHAVLRQLVQKASNNKSKQSTDGPLTVRILDYNPPHNG